MGDEGEISESHLKNIFAVRKQSAFFFALSDKLKIIVRKLRMGITSAITVFLGSKAKFKNASVFRYNFACILSTIVYT